MKKLTALLVGAILMVGMAVFSAPIAQANQIVNGSFENPGLSGDWQGFGYTTAEDILGWQVFNVDIVRNSYYLASDGYNSLDLNGSGPGSISQQFNTILGQKYRLTFDLAGNPLGGGPNVKLATVTTGLVQGIVVFDTNGYNSTNVGWQTLSYDFTAIGTEQILSFVSNTDGTGGPALDNIRVDPVPEPGTMALLGFGLLGLAVYGKRRMNKEA